MSHTAPTRNSNLELFRILSMLWILAHHYAYHGFAGVEPVYSANQYFLGLLLSGGKLGSACFVMLSGYCMVSSRFTLRKLAKLLGQVLFYSWGFALLFLFVLTPTQPVTGGDLLKMLFPVGYELYWFVTDYLVLMLLSPVLRGVLQHTARRTLRRALACAVVFWSVLPTVLDSSYGYTELGWFAVLYLIAGYLRLYVAPVGGAPGRHFAAAAGGYALLLLSNVGLTWLGHRFGIGFFSAHSEHFYHLNSPLVLWIAAELLLGFALARPVYRTGINRAAGATLGVYLIHENYLFRPYLWQTLLHTPEQYASALLPLHALCAIADVYAACTLVDLLRQATAERLFLRGWDRLAAMIPPPPLRKKTLLRTPPASDSCLFRRPAGRLFLCADTAARRFGPY